MSAKNYQNININKIQNKVSDFIADDKKPINEENINDKTNTDNNGEWIINLHKQLNSSHAPKSTSYAFRVREDKLLQWKAYCMAFDIKLQDLLTLLMDSYIEQNPITNEVNSDIYNSYISIQNQYKNDIKLAHLRLLDSNSND